MHLRYMPMAHSNWQVQALAMHMQTTTSALVPVLLQRPAAHRSLCTCHDVHRSLPSCKFNVLTCRKYNTLPCCAGQQSASGPRGSSLGCPRSWVAVAGSFDPDAGRGSSPRPGSLAPPQALHSLCAPARPDQPAQGCPQPSRAGHGGCRGRKAGCRA